MQMHARLAISVFTCFLMTATAGCQHTTQTSREQNKVQSIDKSAKNSAHDALLDSAGLDILQNYNKDLWGGPDAWTKEQWLWKRTLKWDSQCDYVGDVNTLPTALGYDVIQIVCVPGAYQPSQYLFSFDSKSKKHQQFMLGLFGESPQEIIGHVSVNKGSNTLRVLHLSRGTGDCGTLREFQLNGLMEKPKLILTREQACSEVPLSNSEIEARQDVESWREVKK